MTVYGGNGCYGEYGWRDGRGVIVIYNADGVEIGYKDPTAVDSVGAYMQNLDPPWAPTGVCKSTILPCSPVWKCRVPLDGTETDGCGNSRPNPACKSLGQGTLKQGKNILIAVIVIIVGYMLMKR